MKRLCWITFLLGAIAVGGRADESGFSGSIGRADFSAAGLSKLTPAERQRLDELVRDYKLGLPGTTGGAVVPPSPARPEGTAASAAPSPPPVPETKAGSNLLARAKVILAPGTQVEYSTVESSIEGEFRGWNPHTVFKLENGTRWQVLNGTSYVTPGVPGPKVKISPSSFGGFWMTIEGVKGRVKVGPYGVGS